MNPYPAYGQQHQPFYPQQGQPFYQAQQPFINGQAWPQSTPGYMPHPDLFPAGPSQAYAPPLQRPQKYQKDAKPKLKSALKRTATTPGYSNAQLPGQATPLDRRAALPLSRHRTTSNAKRPRHTPTQNIEEASHLFVSLRGKNEIIISNLTALGKRDLRTSLWPQWGSVVAEKETADGWVTRFDHFLWNNDNVRICRLIISLFMSFSVGGFFYLTTINAGTSAPKLVFQAKLRPDSYNPFAGYISSSGVSITLVDCPIAPELIKNSLSMSLAVGVSIKSPQETNPTVFEFVIDTNVFGKPDSSKHKILLSLLNVLFQHACPLLAVLPLHRQMGPLSFGTRGDILIFRG